MEWGESEINLDKRSGTVLGKFFGTLGTAEEIYVKES